MTNFDLLPFSDFGRADLVYITMPRTTLLSHYSTTLRKITSFARFALPFRHCARVPSSRFDAR
jgi:hypothetical protein